jgi:hypothetical protein
LTQSFSFLDFSGSFAEEEGVEKGKGCDIGYALAANSCEGAYSVETCTVTALDAITAFAVPNPNCPSQSRRFFQVWLPCRVAPPG